jgi:nitrite reductase (cytochrome c-552)
LTDVNRACGSCHKQSEQELKDRIGTIQDKTAGLLRETEAALTDAIDAINKAEAAGVGDDALKEARQLHRSGQMRWDFVFSENSTGFHSPQEAARVLADAINRARQAQLAAERVTPRQ